MMIRTSRQFKKAEAKWLGKRVKYYLINPFSRKYKLSGPYTGTVEGLSSNEAMIEDRLEGHDHRNSIQFTGTLFVAPDGGSKGFVHRATTRNCMII